MRWTPLVAAALAALSIALVPVPRAAAAGDVTPPVTTCDAPAGWQRASFIVHFGAADAESGVAAIWAAVDDGAALQVGGPAGGQMEIPAPGDHSTDGVHTLRYYAVDAAGNAESPAGRAVQDRHRGAHAVGEGRLRLQRTRGGAQLPRP